MFWFWLWEFVMVVVEDDEDDEDDNDDETALPGARSGVVIWTSAVHGVFPILII